MILLFLPYVFLYAKSSLFALKLRDEKGAFRGTTLFHKKICTHVRYRIYPISSPWITGALPAIPTNTKFKMATQRRVHSISSDCLAPTDNSLNIEIKLLFLLNVFSYLGIILSFFFTFVNAFFVFLFAFC